MLLCNLSRTGLSVNKFVSDPQGQDACPDGNLLNRAPT